MVACAPTLKKLVGFWLKLGTTQKGSGYGYSGHLGASGAKHSSILLRNREALGRGSGVGNKNLQNHGRSGYVKTEDGRSSELEGHELSSHRGEVYLGRNYVTERQNDVTVTATTCSPTHAGSEEHILQGTIMRTTEVRVHPYDMHLSAGSSPSSHVT